MPHTTHLAVVYLVLLAFTAQLANAQPSTAASVDGGDWLIDGAPFVAKTEQSRDGRELRISNGLVSRSWRLQPNAACFSLEDVVNDRELLRSVRPEAQVTINGERYRVGGLKGQPNHAYLTEAWLDAMTADDESFRCVGVEQAEPVARLAWKQVRHHAPDVSWPPKGKRIVLRFEPPASATELRGITVRVHYELYDGVPVFCKWITVENGSENACLLDKFRAEELAVVEQVNWVETRDGVDVPKPDYLHVETDFAFGGFNSSNANRHIVHWTTDPQYTTQVNYLKQTPCRLLVEPTYGPAQTIPPGGTFESCRAFELIYDDDDRERRGLALRRMYRTIAPWVTENPIMHHMRISRPEAVRHAIRQAVEVGFEMVILSFGSGFNIENTDPRYVAQWKQIADEAHDAGIEIGGYSLLSSRRIGNGNDIVPPAGVSLTHGNCPALTSEWGQNYFKTLRSFFAETGFDLLEHDGPYPGDVDTTPRPPLQKGEQDSRWVQWRITSDFYKHCRANGIYLNTPDYYFLVGSNKCGMGYREVNWSLPRAQQVIHTRQNIFDGTWTKTPSMGWMFVPLSEYHGGGAAATIEPLSEHLDHYESMLAGNLGFGVQACYRGPRIYDTDATRDAVRVWVDWYKRYRDILESDVIHGRRADGRKLDWMLHVNPKLREHRGMLIVHNPGTNEQTTTLDIDVYYTGLKGQATVMDSAGTKTTVAIDAQSQLQLGVTVPPEKWPGTC